MDNFDKTYLSIISEEDFSKSDELILTLEMNWDQSYIEEEPDTEDFYIMRRACRKAGIRFDDNEYGTGEIYETPLSNSSALKKILYRFWSTDSSDLKRCLFDIEKYWKSAHDSNGNEISFEEFFADEIKETGYNHVADGEPGEKSKKDLDLEAVEYSHAMKDFKPTMNYERLKAYKDKMHEKTEKEGFNDLNAAIISTIDGLNDLLYFLSDQGKATIEHAFDGENVSDNVKRNVAQVIELAIFNHSKSIINAQELLSYFGGLEEKIDLSKLKY